MRKKKGFTLIELVVVAAILVILATILFPVFAQARAKARQASCQNNLKQMALAAILYAGDCDNRLPLASFGSASSYAYTWRLAIYPYHKTDLLYTCPAASQLGWNPGDGEIFSPGGYGINAVHSDPGPPTPPPGQSLDTMVSRNTTIFLADQSGWRIQGDGNAHNFARPEAELYKKDKPAQRHRIGAYPPRANYAYCDGHVKRRIPEEVACPVNLGPRQLCPWSSGIVALPTRAAAPSVSAARLEELRATIGKMQSVLDDLKSKLADANQPQPVERE